MAKYQKEYQGVITNYFDGELLHNPEIIGGAIQTTVVFKCKDGSEKTYRTVPMTLNDRLGENLRINENSIIASAKSKGTVNFNPPNACLFTKSKRQALVLLDAKDQPLEGVTLNITMFGPAKPFDELIFESGGQAIPEADDLSSTANQASSSNTVEVTDSEELPS